MTYQIPTHQISVQAKIKREIVLGRYLYREEPKLEFVLARCSRSPDTILQWNKINQEKCDQEKCEQEKKNRITTDDHRFSHIWCIPRQIRSLRKTRNWICPRQTLSSRDTKLQYIMWKKGKKKKRDYLWLSLHFTHVSPQLLSGVFRHNIEFIVNQIKIIL